MALELKSLLPWICSLQELFGLAILLERHVCVSLVRIQVVVQDHPSYERSFCVFFSTQKSPSAVTFYCCRMTSFCLEFWEVVVGDITTILGFFSLSFDKKPCNNCGKKLSVFLVLRSTGAATENPCRSRIALK